MLFEISDFCYYWLMLNEAKIEELRESFLDSLKKVKSEEELENLRIDYIGRKQGKLTTLFSEIPKLSLEQKIKLVPGLNELKSLVEDQLSNFNLETITKKQPKKRMVEIPRSQSRRHSCNRRLNNNKSKSLGGIWPRL